jgi:hypothetical protein
VLNALNGSKVREALRREIEDHRMTLAAIDKALEQARTAATAEALEQRWAVVEEPGKEMRTKAALANERIDELAGVLGELTALFRRSRARPRRTGPGSSIARLHQIIVNKLIRLRRNRYLPQKRISIAARRKIISPSSAEVKTVIERCILWLCR